MHKQLIDIIMAQVGLTDTDRQLCLQYFEPVPYARNTVLEEQGKIPGHLYFVVSGFVRLYHYNDKGDEVTTHINCPPGFITSYAHFINQTIASDTLECITACELLRITKKGLDHLIDQSRAFRDFSIQVFQQSLAYNENRARDLATLSAEQRYLKLMAGQPEVIRHVPVQYIASFLGMNPKSLSRIRKQIIR
ncbi:Crp/Fnr family transcriptional regulator [Emticicia fluvialis]|uniref:Crp/Fnr family transcriptional regulator n=1 Tax=Emticicia fluvialis TaxID=2974474 RepID=UPI0021652933|nr:Crp/Fnr family transcriptional regulator [Emticicia fluvialis]